MKVSELGRNFTIWEQALLVRSRGAETRRKILYVLLTEGALCYSDIAKELKLTVATVSRHCGILKKIQLLDNERIGNMSMCHLTERAEKIVDILRMIKLD